MRRVTAPLGLVVLLWLVLEGCMVGPNYKRPNVPAPPQFRNTDPAAGAGSLANTKWFDLFQDAALTGLVNDALANNFDLLIASERVLEARAALGVTRSQLYPQANFSGTFVAGRSSTIGATPLIPAGTNTAVSYTQAGFAVNWELDLWGRIRRMTESARAQYLASEEARRGVTTTLISDVTSTYFELRDLDLELEISTRTRDVAENSLRLINARHTGGAATGLDVSQAEQFLYTATAQIASTERSLGETEDALSLLLGRSPGDIQRGKTLEGLILPVQVPPGLPSELLARRPDIRQAEQTLISANAEIGAAKALYFPQITLSGLLGQQSRDLTAILTGPARLWSIAPALAAPIFTGGRLRSNVRLTEAQQREALIAYRKTIENAFREVSDALIDYQKTGQQRAQQELLVKALNESDRLSTLRYRGGLDSYLQVLDAERNLFAGQLLLVQLRRQELVAVVQLYRALGGGWQ
jgi:NodT family efflux transporter outer membrane factor (OMF) lipoprotein